MGWPEVVRDLGLAATWAFVLCVFVWAIYKLEI